MCILSYDNLKKCLRAILPFMGMITVFILFHFTDWVALKYYPVCMNFIFFSTFFLSTFRKETVIQKMARKLKPDLQPIELDYTRKLTYVWSTFCFTNFVISLVTVFMPEYVWYIYNGVISYMLVGLVFGIEFIARKRFKKKHGL